MHNLSVGWYTVLMYCIIKCVGGGSCERHFLRKSPKFCLVWQQEKVKRGIDLKGPILLIKHIGVVDFIMKKNQARHGLLSLAKLRANVHPMQKPIKNQPLSHLLSQSIVV
jgi:hypothetical protein